MSEAVELTRDRWQAVQYKSPQALASGVADRFLDVFKNTEGRKSIALSGGRITETLFRELVSQSKERGHTWAEFDFFWADERCVSLDDGASNYRLANELLFTPLQIAKEQTFPFAGGKEPAAMAAEGCEMLRQYFGVGNADIPVVDLAFLGMGEDGHIASLFPENRESDLVQTAPCYDVVASKPPPNRITLSYPILQSAREVWLVVSGTGKAPVLKDALRGSGNTPLQTLLSMRSNTKVFTDLDLDSL